MRITAICLLLWVSSALAWAGSLQGTVKDSQGHPVKGAEVRIESKKFVKMIATDAKGHYLCDGLTAGTDYRVTVVVNGSVKASILNTRTGEHLLNKTFITQESLPAHGSSGFCTPRAKPSSAKRR